MATAAFIPQVWSSYFLRRLRETLVWGSRTNRNYEGEIANYGATVKIPTPTTTITVRDYSAGTDIMDPQMTSGTTQDLSINKQRYYHFIVDDVERAQEKPDLMEDAVREAAFQMSKKVDDDVRTEFNTAYDSGRRIATQAQHPDVTDKTFGDNFLRNLAKAKRTMSEANMPMESRWIIVNPHIIEGIEKYFLLVNPAGIFLPATQEQALRNGFSGRLLGFDIYTANTIPDGALLATKATYRLYIGQGTEAVTFANQITENVAYRPEKRFADAVKGLMVYGQKCVLPTRLYTLEIQKAA